MNPDDLSGVESSGGVASMLSWSSSVEEQLLYRAVRPRRRVPASPARVGRSTLYRYLRASGWERRMSSKDSKRSQTLSWAGRRLENMEITYST